ncbi:hypothetical protein C8R46DRAFT_505936 [Mycena filopes]|nr:hypothetical protein C8R46DRAFT_505936 [Mycena filopes]
MADGQLYTKQLLCKGLGYPLWYPSPMDNLPEAYRRDGVQIGDVGCITPRGGFSFLFNICKKAEDAINRQFGVPDNFQPLQLDTHSVERMDVAFQPQSDISTETVTSRRVSLGMEINSAAPIDVGVGIELSCSANEGAALILLNGASSSDLLPLHIFRKYILAHAKHWFEFLAALNRPVQDIYLVTGCDKSSSWGTAVFSRTSNNGEATMKLGPTGIAGHAEYSWDNSSYNHGFAQAGPHRKPGEESWGENQCVFLRGYTVSMRNKLKSVFTGQVKVDAIKGSSNSPIQASLSERTSRLPSQPSPQSTGSLSSSSGKSPKSRTVVAPEGMISLEYSSEVSQAYHPSAVINTCLLDRPGVTATIAVTHDRDWIAAMGVNPIEFPETQDLFVSVLQVRSVVEGEGAVYWDAEDPLGSTSTSTRSPAPSDFLGPILADELTSPISTHHNDRQQPEMSYPVVGISPPARDFNRTELNKNAQRRGAVIQYEDSQTGRLSEPIWSSVVYFNNYEYGRGTGSTIVSARERAARQALDLISQGY